MLNACNVAPSFGCGAGGKQMDLKIILQLEQYLVMDWHQQRLLVFCMGSYVGKVECVEPERT